MMHTFTHRIRRDEEFVKSMLERTVVSMGVLPAYILVLLIVLFCALFVSRF
jgi:hypothetical protein